MVVVEGCFQQNMSNAAQDIGTVLPHRTRRPDLDTGKSRPTLCVRAIKKTRGPTVNRNETAC